MSTTQMPNSSTSRSPGIGNTIEEDREDNLDNIDCNEDLFNDSPTIIIGDTLKICQINVEGLTRMKSEYLSRLMSESHCDVLLLQETHCADTIKLTNLGQITNFTCIESINHRHHGIATYVKTQLVEVCEILLKEYRNGISYIITKVNTISILNVYKPPNVSWIENLPVLVHPAIYMGDFNSHHMLWGYTEDDDNGSFITDWAINSNIHLMYDTKELPTFHSGRWNRGFNPDLCFVSTDDCHIALPAIRTVKKHFPRSQHRPVFVELGLQIPFVPTSAIPRWNFKTADWIGYSKALDSNIRWIAPFPKNWDRFVGIVISTAKKFIHRGYRKSYIPTWNAECEALYTSYKESGSKEIGSQLLNSLNNARSARWIEMVQNIDFKHSSRKAWDFLKKFGASKKSNTENIFYPLHPNKVAEQLIKNSNNAASPNRSHIVQNQFRRSKRKITESPFAYPVSVEEVNLAIRYLKPGKACGLDNIFAEFIINCSKNTRVWLSKFFSNCYSTNSIPPIWNKSKIRAILKPGKTPNLPENFRPISLLCIGYKLLERIIYNRIGSTIFETLPTEQAGFRPGRNCCDQVLSLVTHIEAGLQDHKKTAVVFVDLSSAYDSVWKTGLLLKLSKIIKCRQSINLISTMLSNRKFCVILGKRISKFRSVNDGLPQGSVMAPVLFNIYTADLPNTSSRKFIYADDLALAIQFEYGPEPVQNAENIMTSDLCLLSKYYKEWKMIPNLSKTEASIFHLSNSNATEKFNTYFRNKLVNFNANPKYLGVTLDRSLTFKQHCFKLRQKLKSRINIIQKLSGLDWGASAHALRVSSLSLVYPTAEYCAPVWNHSFHVHHIDTQLNLTMRIITGCLKSTPKIWLPILSNIAPPKLRREAALVKEAIKIIDDPNLHIHQDLANRNINRLSSRTPLWSKIQEIGNLDLFSLDDKWVELFNNYGEFTNKNLIVDPTIQLEGFNIPRRIWCTINRIRSNHAKTNCTLHRWNEYHSPLCECGDLHTVDHIINYCRFTKFNGDGILELHQLTPNAITWLENLDLRL